MDQVVICRLCLNLLQPKEAVALFSSNGPTLMGTMVQAIYPIKLKEGDGPNSTCSECLVKVGNSYKLYKQVVRCQAQISTYWPSIPDILDSVGNFPDPVLPISNGNEPSTTFQNKPEKRMLQYPKHIQSEIKRQYIMQSNNDMDISSEFDSVDETVPRPSNEIRNVDSDESVVENESSPLRQLREKRKRISYTENDNTLRYQCEICDKGFDKLRSYHLHKRIHKTPVTPVILPVIAPFQQPKLPENNDSKQLTLLSCELCQKKFKYQIQLKRHIDFCAASTNDAFDNLEGEEQCSFCNGKFNSIMNLKNHIRDAHAGLSLPLSKVNSHPNAVSSKEKYEWVACHYCKEETFNSYKVFTHHINQCPKRTLGGFFSCVPCNVQYSSKSSFFSHMRRKHFEAARELEKRSSEFVEQPLHETDYEENEEESDSEQFECPVCLDGFARQDQLVEHLTVHMMEADGGLNSGNFNKAPQPTSNSNETSVKCQYCDRVFINKRALNVHVNRQHFSKKVERKNGKTSKNLASSDSEELDTTCDICDKIFSYRRTLLIHKKNKHRGVPGVKITTVQFRKCRMRCLICNVEMTVEESFTHIKEHSVSSIKGMLEYRCRGCGSIFRTTQGLRDHIHTEHRHRKDSGSTGERTDDVRNEFIGHTVGSEFSKEIAANIKTEITDSPPIASHNIATRAQSKYVPEQVNKELEDENTISETAHKAEIETKKTLKQENNDSIQSIKCSEQTEADSSLDNVVSEAAICNREQESSITNSTRQKDNSEEEQTNSSNNNDLEQNNSSLEQENGMPEQINNVAEPENCSDDEQSCPVPEDGNNIQKKSSSASDQGNLSLGDSNEATEQLRFSLYQTKSVNVARKKTTQIPANIIKDRTMDLGEDIDEDVCERISESFYSDEGVTAQDEEASTPSKIILADQSATIPSHNATIVEEGVDTKNPTKHDDVNEIPNRAISRSGNVARKKTTQIPGKDIKVLEDAQSVFEGPIIDRTLVEDEIAGMEERNGFPDEDWVQDEENMTSSEESKSEDQTEPNECKEELRSPNKVPRVCLSGFTCPQCGKTLENVRSFRAHINWHATRGKTMEKKIECKICHEVFKYGTHYRIHMKSHWSDRNLDPKFLTCGTCGKLSATLRSAQIHERVHSTRHRARPHHTCTECGKNFQFRKYYLTHVLTHHNVGNDGET